VTAASLRLSILDLAPIEPGLVARDTIATSVALAQRAEELGYHRVWYAEHHNMARIASSATSVMIAHIGAQTSTIRLGAGGVMLPNHAPLTVAEQFGTLEAMYPGRIDLGLGRAPGSDQKTMYALRRDPSTADNFPRDVVELQGYLTGQSRVAGVDAVPGKGSNVPLFILGSSLYGAKLAAALSLPYAFASHFAPDALQPALAAYREDFQPSEQLEQPYVIAGVGVIAADSPESAAVQLQAVRRLRAITLFGQQLGNPDGEPTDEQADQLLATRAAATVDRMLTYTAVGTPHDVRDYLNRFASSTGADELITTHHAPTSQERLRSITLLTEAIQPTTPRSRSPRINGQLPQRSE
jgi:luciferase family oxidoreductase group 1